MPISYRSFIAAPWAFLLFMIASQANALNVEYTDTNGVKSSVVVSDSSPIANILARIQSSCQAAPSNCSSLVSQEMAALNSAGLGGYITSVFDTAIAAISSSGQTGNSLASSVAGVFSSVSNVLRNSGTDNASRDVTILANLVERTKTTLDSSGADETVKNAAIAKVAVSSLLTLKEKATTLSATSPIMVNLTGLASSSTDAMQSSAINTVLVLIGQGQTMENVMQSDSAGALSRYASPA